MDWIFENIQVLIAIGAGIAFWLNKSREEREQRRQMEEEQASPGWEEGTEYDFEEDDAANEALEEFRPPALPPNIVVHQRTPPPLPSAADAEAERQREVLERLKTLRAERAVRSAARKSPAPVVSSGSLHSRLRDRDEVRRAIVLREILGPPVGLK